MVDVPAFAYARAAALRERLRPLQLPPRGLLPATVAILCSKADVSATASLSAAPLP